MSGDLFRKLSALGLNVEQIAGVVDIIDERDAERAAKDEEGREKARERWRRWKNKQGTNVSKRLPTDANVSKPLARVEDNLPTKEISGQEDKKERSPKKATRLPEDWQLPDDWRQEAMVAGLPAHRVDPEVRKMVNWSRSSKAGAKLDWRAAWRNWFQRAIDDAPPQRQSTSPPHQLDRVNAILDAMQGNPHVPQYPGPTIDAGIERTDWSGAPNLVQLHAVSSRGRS